MTGLDVEKDQILEMACLITDCDLNVLAEVSTAPGAASRSTPPPRPHEGSAGPGMPNCPERPPQEGLGYLVLSLPAGPQPDHQPARRAAGWHVRVVQGAPREGEQPCQSHFFVAMM